MIAGAATLRVLWYEAPGAGPIDAGLRFEVVRALLSKGYPVAIARDETQLGSNGAQGVVILGRFAGSARPAFASSGETKVYVRDVDGMAAGAIIDAVEAIASEIQPSRPAAWKPWFPVIDYGRCTNCMQCLSFCLFDVYGVSKDGKIRVQNENHCKTDCPACSRVCPEVAIIFPKYRFGPINGDQINPQDVRRDAIKVDISALLGGDIYQMLRDRSERAKSRFSKERDDQLALKERQRCLEKFRETLDIDIPPEVLASLPTPQQILSRAEEAKARADAAIQSNELRDSSAEQT